MSNVISLSDARLGDRGVITRVSTVEGDEHGAELERRLLELGFVEGAQIQLLHQGVIGRDPMALKVDDMRVALRRREARGLSVELFAEAAE
jgi:ferrous iron transport protein A